MFTNVISYVQKLDARLEALGGKRAHALGMADERHELEEVEPWIDSFWANGCFVN